MSAITKCDNCGVERSGRRLKFRVSMRVHVAPSAPVEQAQVLERDICSDGCLIAMAQKRIQDRADRKAREASEGAVVTPTPIAVPPRAVSA